MSGTYTSEGFIPHLLVDLPSGPILAPVKLETEMGKVWGSRSIATGWRDARRVAKPMKREGRYVYALPGGGEVLG